MNGAGNAQVRDDNGDGEDDDGMDDDDGKDDEDDDENGGLGSHDLPAGTDRRHLFNRYTHNTPTIHPR